MGYLTRVDTPCTAALHLLTRDPEIAERWFSGRNGCFEVPDIDKQTSKVSIPKLQVMFSENLIYAKKSTSYITD